MTTNENGITNGIEIYKNRAGALRVMASNNDCELRSFDGETVKLSRWPRCAPLEALDIQGLRIKLN